jgi:hypothetical protein
MRELRALFTDLRRQHPEAETVQGGSWLYNLPAYRALFPPEYVATATPTRPGFTFLDVWGSSSTAIGMCDRNRHSHSEPVWSERRVMPIWKPAFPSGRSEFGADTTPLRLLWHRVRFSASLYPPPPAQWA